MVLERIREDIQSVFDNDPAAKNRLEVVLTYPGLHALWFHRLARALYRRRLFTTARLVSHLARFLTGVEIHPGATIGHRVFIDHGMGVVIGETAEIGDDCLLYKGVVLGGTSSEKKKRHPTLGRCVVVGSNACILGAITIGDGARIGSGSVVVRSVPPGVTVVGIPGKIVRQKQHDAGHESDDPFRDKLQHADLPDPLIEVLATWMKLLEKYEDRLQKLEQSHQIISANMVQAFKQDILELGLNQDPDKITDTAGEKSRCEESSEKK
ncbi:MAG TPA: serine O-acetyltransferase [bacterium]|nr:serine O-acetyltransferase [bacterium]